MCCKMCFCIDFWFKLLLDFWFKLLLSWIVFMWVFFILLSLTWTRTFCKLEIIAKNDKNLTQIIAKIGNIWTNCLLYTKRIKLLPKMANIWVKLLPKMANIWVKLLPKMAIFGQAVSYTWIKSNYCQKWQYLDKGSSKMDAKSCQKWQKKNEQKLPLLATEHSSIVYLCLAWMVVCFPDSWSQL